MQKESIKESVKMLLEFYCELGVERLPLQIEKKRPFFLRKRSLSLFF